MLAPYAEPVGSEPREHRGVALTGRLHIEIDGERAVAGEGEPGALERRAAGMLEHAGNADAAIFAARFRCAPARLEAIVTGERQRLVEDGRKIAAVIGGADGGLVGHGGGGNKVAPPQLYRIDAGDARGLLDHALEHVVRLRPSGAAIGRGRNCIGEDAARAHIDMPDVVHAGQAAGEIPRRDVGANGADIGAEIGGVADAQRQEAALAVERQFRLGIEVARLGVAEKRLGTSRHPMNRAAEFLGGDQLRDVFRIGAGLQAESAADVVGQHPQALLRHVHDGNQDVAHGAGALRADAQRVTVGRGIVARGGAARLDRGDSHALIHDRDARHEFCRGEDGIDLAGIGLGIGGRPRPVDGEIARSLRPDLRRAGFKRGARVGHRGERVVFDRYELGGILRGERALGDDHRHRLADMHDPVGRERRAVRHHQPLATAPVERRMTADAAEPFHILRGQCADDAGCAQRRADVQADDARKSMRRTHEIGVGLVRQRNIGGVAAVTAHERIVLQARLARRAMLDFCIHALFRMIYGYQTAPLITETAAR